MKHNVHRTVVLIVYFCTLFFVLFYPGKNTHVTLYTTHPALFDVLPFPSFTPAQLPVVDTSFLPQVSAQSWYVVDVRTMTPLLGFNENDRRSPASTVKLAGALVALAHDEPTSVYTVKNEIAEEVRMGLIKGEKIVLLNLLYASLINSANDAAQAIADNYPGGEKAFITQMNSLAKKLHLKNTRFVNPIGFDHPEQFSTASDLAILGARGMSNPLIRTITSTTAITVSDTSFQLFHPLINSNELVGTVPGVGGAKTGKTEQAQENLITYYLHNKKNPIVIVLMGSQNRFEDTRAIISFLNTNLRYVPFLSTYAFDTAGR